MSLDGISRLQKVAAVEECFRGCPDWFGGIWEYIGEEIRSGDPRGAHKAGGDVYYYSCGHVLGLQAQNFVGQ